MNNFERIKNMPVEDLAVFLDSILDEQPWSNYFQKTYCDHCNAIEKTVNGKTNEYSYCELNDYFCQKLPGVNVLDSAVTVKIWLNADVEKGSLND